LKKIEYGESIVNDKIYRDFNDNNGQDDGESEKYVDYNWKSIVDNEQTIIKASLVNNLNRNTSYHRRLINSGTFGGRSQLFENLKKIYDSKLYNGYSRKELHRHEMSYLDMNSGTATSQYVVQENDTFLAMM
jgi:hypothetical protein